MEFWSENCRCQEYKKIVEKFHFFVLGTFHHVQSRLPAPKGYCIKWVKNECSYHDPRYFKPILVKMSNELESEEIADGKADENIKTELPSKWIPVLPGLISQRIVNVNRRPGTILV